MERGLDNITEYQDLARELRRLWNVKTQLVPIVIGTLDGMPKDLEDRLKVY